VQLTLTPEIENALEEQARQQGTTPEHLALEALREKFVTPITKQSIEGTLADFLADFAGVLDSNEHVSGGAQMSEESGKKYAQGMVEKRAKGHL
jgi:hypothetical protein